MPNALVGDSPMLRKAAPKLQVTLLFPQIISALNDLYSLRTVSLKVEIFKTINNTVKMDSLTGNKLSGVQKEELMDQVKQQVAVMLAQELIQKITEKCFKKCITKPGSSLDNSEQKCLSMCMDRYMDSFGLVSRTYATRLQREKGSL